MTPFSRRSLLLAGAAIAVASCSQANGAKNPAAGEMSLGKANAPITVIEYASFACGHCAVFNNTVFPQIKAKYIDTGQVRWVFREFITPPAELAAAGALLARCAGPDKYFNVADAIFHGQEEMFKTGDMRGVLLRVAQSAGMTEQQFQACVTDEKAIQAFNSRVEGYAKTDKVTATPTFIINGKKVAEGEMTLAQFDAHIAAARKK